MHNGRVVKLRKPGLSPDAPFWQGKTAERIVAKRLKENLKEKEAKRLARAAARVARSSSPTTRKGNTAPATLVPKELRRLERALTRRKTLAARQRVSARIAELKKELGL